jgi:hypothetical protein
MSASASFPSSVPRAGCDNLLHLSGRQVTTFLGVRLRLGHIPHGRRVGEHDERLHDRLEVTVGDHPELQPI